MKRIWMDVEDLFAFAQAGARLTGIQRVVLEICAAFMADPHMADHVGFVRHNVQGTGFVVVSWAQVQAVWQALSGQDTEQPEKMQIRSLSTSHTTNQSLLQKCGQHVPVSVRVPAGKLIRNSQSAVQAGSALVRGLWGLASHALRKKDNLNV